MIGGWDKAYGTTHGNPLYDVSYQNLIMYNAVLPSYDYKSNNNDKNKKINASDPKNREAAHKIMFG